MKFGPVPLDEAGGAILAHSLVLESGTIRKGTVLGANHILRIGAEGFTEIVAARLEDGDFSEDRAAAVIGESLKAEGLKLGPVFTGRVNLVADMGGVVTVDDAAIAAMNTVDEGLTLATLPDLVRVGPNQLVATVKVIPYGLSSDIVGRGAEKLGSAPIVLHPFKSRRVQLIMTKVAKIKEKLLIKGQETVRGRVEGLGMDLSDTKVVAHDEEAVAAAIDPGADIILILGASATSDRADVIPRAVCRAGGRIERFGMPVDPGNLLVLGSLDGVPVVGLPGCARSPALNGVDWVLERLAAGIAIDGAAIAGMGVGGLLKEMAARPQPRRPR